MGESSGAIAYGAIGKQGNPLPRGATHCTGNFHAAVARARWPRKTAEHWAEAAGVKTRMAKYWLAGAHPVSDSGKLALIRELE